MTSELRHRAAAMTPQSLNFEVLLAPIGVGQFLERYWERSYLHIEGRSPGYYQSLLTTTDIEQIVCNPDARFPAIQMARGGKYFPPEAYTRDVKFGSEVFTGVPDLQRISIEYRNGASVVLPALHRSWKPLRNLCATLEAQIDHVPHANAYITPGNAAGFTPHYDVHEVLVLQIAGSKRWSLYPAPIRLPYRSEPFTPHGYSVPTPLAHIDLNPGDLLYLPRGQVHSAVTSESYSAHVTIGITVYTWADLASGLSADAAADETLRQALPAGFATRAELRGLLRQRLAALSGHRTGIDHDELIDRFLQRVRSGRSVPAQGFRIDVVAIDANSPLQAPAPHCYRISMDAGATILEFNSKRHILPGGTASTLRAMSERDVFRTADLPGEMSIEARLGLSRYLLEVGFLSVSTR